MPGEKKKFFNEINTLKAKKLAAGRSIIDSAMSVDHVVTNANWVRTRYDYI